MLKLSSLFGDHAVLQRGISIPVWGWTEPAEKVECSFGGQVCQVRSGLDGKFLLRLAPMSYSGPYELTVRNLKSGESVTVRDIMVGEVWLASGQSNMDMRARETNDKELYRTADLPQVRMITISKTARVGGLVDVQGEWQISTPETVGDFSAAGFYFARRIANELGVAVGIIHSSWGGTIAESWSSRQALIGNPDQNALVQDYERMVFEAKIWEKDDDYSGDPLLLINKVLNEKLHSLDLSNQGEKSGWAAPDFDDSAWRLMTLPTHWQLAGEEYCGAVWFRRVVELPENAAENAWTLHLGAVDKHDVSYVNGVIIGGMGEGFDQSCWNIPREYTMPAGVFKPGRNVIAVRAFTFMYGGGLIGPKDQMKLFPAGQPEQALALVGEWRFKAEIQFEDPSKSFQRLLWGPGAQNSPYMLYENMIRPLQPYAIAGVIWYQGESNASKWQYYRNLLENLIRDWRYAWGQGDFPFYQVQLANYGAESAFRKDSNWAFLREAQLQAAAVGGGVAVAIDCGEAADIHPKDKKTVGERLAALALFRNYHRYDVVPCGPVYSRMVLESDKIRLYFDHCEGGLEGTGGFYIAGDDGAFKAADAIIEGSTVVVSHPELANPRMVRYGWADNPTVVELRNKAGFPASPFRTDC